ncbi:MAG: hypothetical protein ACLFQV_13465 [Vulcanimicrobiota bacterium]
MGSHKIKGSIESENQKFNLRIAEETDMDSLKDLYFQVYGGKYTLPEVVDPDKMKWAINDPNFVWLVTETDKKLVGSVLFVMEKKHKLGKSLAGVVLPEFRGHKLMRHALKTGLDYILYEKDYVDVVYGVVRTFVTGGFHKDLKELGFVDIGIFPNVRKVSKYETHGLKALFKPEALQKRNIPPTLIPQANEIYEIVRERLELEKAQVVDYTYNTPAKFTEYKFETGKSPDIEWKYYKERDKNKLQMSFYPFHYPEILLHTPDKTTRAYIHFEERDGHGDLMGLYTENPGDLTSILNSIAEEAEDMGIKYLELLVSAYDYETQKKAYEADFIPCAYFPAVEMEEDKRLDFVAMCRNFVPLNFKEMKLTDDTRAYIRSYFKLCTLKLWEDLKHA